jgi:hypothetical protein
VLVGKAFPGVVFQKREYGERCSRKECIHTTYIMCSLLESGVMNMHFRHYTVPLHFNHAWKHISVTGVLLIDGSWWSIKLAARFQTSISEICICNVHGRCIVPETKWKYEMNYSVAFQMPHTG